MQKSTARKVCCIHPADFSQLAPRFWNFVGKTRVGSKGDAAETRVVKTYPLFGFCFVRSFAGHVPAIRAATEGRQGAPLLEHCGVVRLIEINLAFWSMGAA